MVEGDILVIADGAAFGAMIEKCLEIFGSEDNRRITGWFPESFEYLILCSGLVDTKNLKDILENTWEYVDCKEYVSLSLIHISEPTRPY